MNKVKKVEKRSAKNMPQVCVEKTVLNVLRQEKQAYVLKEKNTETMYPSIKTPDKFK